MGRPALKSSIHSTEPSQPESASETFDLIVIGAGIAGAVSACVAAEAGLRTLLVDKSAWPRDKVCGCCLNDQALMSLASAGLETVLHQLPAVQPRNMRLYTGRREAAIGLPTTRVIGRRELDEALAQHAIDRGALFMPKTRAAVLPTDFSGNRAVRLSTSGGRSWVVQSRWVIAADGLASGSLRRLSGFQARVSPSARIGLGARLPARVDGFSSEAIHMFVPPMNPGGYAGAVRLPNGEVDVAACVDPAWVRSAGGPRRALSQLFAAVADGGAAGHDDARRAQGLLDGLEAPKVMGTPTLTRRRRKVAEPGLLVAGDAAGYVEPFTGEGMAWAATSGLMAAQLVQQSVAAGSEHLAASRWPKTLHHGVRQRQTICKVSSAVLRRPGLVQAACLAGPMVSPLFHWVRPKARKTDSFIVSLHGAAAAVSG